MGLFTKLFGTRSEHEVKKIMPTVNKILALEDEYKALDDDALRRKTQEFKDRLAQGETLDDILPEAFATAREAADRVLGLRPYPVQLIGGLIKELATMGEDESPPAVSDLIFRDFAENNGFAASGRKHQERPINPFSPFGFNRGDCLFLIWSRFHGLRTPRVRAATTAAAVPAADTAAPASAQGSF